MNIFFPCVLGLFLACFAAPSTAWAENIRVAIDDNRTSVSLSSSTGLMGGLRSERVRGTHVQVRAESFGRKPLRFRSRSGPVAVDGRPYRGIVEIRKKRNGALLVVNELDLEDYLKGVIAAEIPSDWEIEALKAQAVASRTYALYEKRNRGKRPYHIMDTVENQVYLGARGERRRSVGAVNATAGEVLLYEGDVIAAFYHASCGGRTEDASVLWGIDEPYLKGVDCDCQKISTYGLWEKRFTVASVLSALRREGYRLGRIQAVESGSITPGGRVKDVLFRTRGGTTAVPAERIRATLGYSRVPSIFFEPELVEREVVFSGRGHGHGIGLCQWGAREMAQRGYAYGSILRHYYPGTRIGPMP